MFAADTGHDASPAIAYTEMDLPRSLWRLATVSAQLLLGLATVALLMRLSGRLDLLRGPWFIWTLPALAIAATVPVIGTPRYRAPGDPFLLLLAAPLIGSLLSKVERLLPERRSDSQTVPHLSWRTKSG